MRGVAIRLLAETSEGFKVASAPHSSSQLDKRYPSYVKGKALKHLESSGKQRKNYLHVICGCGFLLTEGIINGYVESLQSF